MCADGENDAQVQDRHHVQAPTLGRGSEMRVAFDRSQSASCSIWR